MLLGLNSHRGIERRKEDYQATNITLIFMCLVDLFFDALFLNNFSNLKNEADCLSVNSLINRDPE